VKLQTHRVGVSCDSLIERHVEGGDVLSENESEEEIEVKKKGARGAKIQLGSARHKRRQRLSANMLNGMNR
jgi:hypothetical protein